MSYNIPSILFLKGIHISTYKPIEEMATLYFTRNENVINDNADIDIYKNIHDSNINYGKIPSVFNSLETWNIENVKCYYTDILLNGKYPFIPLNISYVNKIKHDELNKIDIKALNKTELVNKTKKNSKLLKNVKNINENNFENNLENTDNNYINVKQLEIKTYGVFYNFNIAVKFIEEKTDWTEQEKWEKIEMLKKLHFIWHNSEMKFIQIPSKYNLNCYGGNITLEEYKIQITE